MAKKKKMDMTMPAMPHEAEDGSERDYMANSAYRAMIEADEHRANPAMMKRVAKVAERHLKTASKVMRSVADIKEYSKKTFPAVKRYERKE